MTTLAQLRNTITTTQRRVLDVVMDYLLVNSKPMPIRSLQGDLGRTTVTEAVSQLGGSVIFEIHQEGHNCYQISQLGLLLCCRGQEGERLLQKYVRFLRKEFKNNIKLEKLSNKEIQAVLKLDPDEMQLLFLTLTLSSHARLGSRYGGSGSDGTWYMNVDDDVTELSERAQPALREWIEQQVLLRYDEKAPVTELGRAAKMLSAQKSLFSSNASQPTSTGYSLFQNISLDFVRDESLRSNLLADLEEANMVYGVGAWKSCVILCGGALEGLLLSQLLSRKQEAVSAGRRLRVKAGDPSEWRLIDLVSVAEELGVLNKGTVHLTHAIREFRNLVHPGKQHRDQLSVSKDEAKVAMSVVQLVMRAFENPNQ